MARPRIAIFLPSLSGGGAERAMANLAEAFARRGLDVDMVLAEASGPYLETLSPDVRVVDLGASRVLAAVPRLARYLHREPPRALLSALTYANLAALWAGALSRSGTRLVISEQNFLSISARNAATLRKRTTPLLARLFYGWADGITVISQGVGDDLAATARIAPDRMTLIHNPAVTPALAERAAAPVDHPWFAGDAPVVVAVGRLVPQKDYPTLIRAFRALRDARPARLLILGEGDDRAALEGQVADLGLDEDVAMPGFVDNPAAYVSRADVFALSSSWEGFGNVVAEALGVGCPVVSTDCPSGPAEILDGGRFGRLVPVGDPRGLAAAIAATLNDPPDRAALVERAQAFSIEPIADRYVALLLDGTGAGYPSTTQPVLTPRSSAE